MNVPGNLKYTNDHEWALVAGDVATIGITEYAAGELGDVVYVELPSVGDTAVKGDSIGTIEAVKTVTDIYSPVSGEVVEVNEALADTSELVNKDPYGEGWIVKIKLSNPAEFDGLLSPEDYKKLV
ncbi:MAG: glycine cleavage system protein GcvH [Candidatus Marinimicrobia bacterium]|jgi:glycine cleavage system H protein|nr:glycine cleavage system protein GcvH [Candidatus Neomarinimicrobiota bacterium]